MQFIILKSNNTKDLRLLGQQRDNYFAAKQNYSKRQGNTLSSELTDVTLVDKEVTRALVVGNLICAG